MELLEKTYLERKFAAFAEVHDDMAKKAALDAVMGNDDDLKIIAVHASGVRDGVLKLAKIIGVDADRIEGEITKEEKLEMATEIEKDSRKNVADLKRKAAEDLREIFGGIEIFGEE